MANKLDARGVAIAFTVVTAIIYIACFLIVLIAGDSSLKFFQLFFHGVDITSLSTTPDVPAGLFGLVISAIVAYASGYVFALVYNKYS